MGYPRYQRPGQPQQGYSPQPPQRPQGSWLDAIGLTPVTFALIAINDIVFILQNVPATALFMDYQALSLWSLYNGMWWTLLTSMFMHGGIMHIVFNMIALYCFGPTMERAFGPGRFVVLYLACGIIGGLVFVATCYLTLTPNAVVGASGAIFGLLGAYGVMLLREFGHPVILAGRPSTQMVVSYLALIALNIVVSLSPGIAMESHAGGFVSGVLLGLLFYSMIVRKIKRLRGAGGATGAGW